MSASSTSPRDPIESELGSISGADGLPGRNLRELAMTGGNDLTEPDYLIDPFIKRGVRTVMWGNAGSLKSMLAGAIAYSCAYGDSIIEGWKVGCSGGVLILDAEDSWEEWVRRLTLLSRGAGHDRTQLYRTLGSIRYVEVPPGGIRDATKGFGHYHETFDLGLVDTLGSAATIRAPGAEDNGPAKEVFKLTQPLARTIVGTHHGLKYGGGVAYGSSYFTNLAREVYEVQRTGSTVSIASGKSNRRGTSAEPLALEFTEGADGAWFRFEAVQSSLNAPVKRISTQEFISRLWADGRDDDDVKRLMEEDGNRGNSDAGRRQALFIAREKLRSHPATQA